MFGRDKKRGWVLKTKPKDYRNSNRLEKLALGYISLKFPRVIEIKNCNLYINGYYVINNDITDNVIYESLSKLYKVKGEKIEKIGINIIDKNEAEYDWSIIDNNNNVLYYVKSQPLPTLGIWNNSNSEMSELKIYSINGIINELYEKKTNKSMQRFHLYKELYDTEKTYITDLKLLNVFCIQCNFEKVISEEESAILFGNYQDLLDFHNQLLKQLDSNLPDKKFSTFMPYIYQILKVGEIKYVDYCENYNKSFPLYSHLIDNNPDFLAFVNFCATHPLARGCRLDSFLIKPVQRICKYHLIFRDILKNWENNDNIRIAEDIYKTCLNIADVINSKMKSHENSALLLELSQKIIGADDLVTTDRSLVLEARLNCTVNDNIVPATYGFFFSDILYLVREHKGVFSQADYKVVDRIYYYGIDDCEFEGNPDTSNNNIEFLYQSVHNKESERDDKVKIEYIYIYY